MDVTAMISIFSIFLCGALSFGTIALVKPCFAASAMRSCPEGTGLISPESPTSPKGSFGTTAPYGSRDMPFNLAELVSAAGASYVARWTTTHPIQLSKAIQKGLENEGFSFIEVVSQCPTYFGRKNKMRTPLEMFQWIKENSINKRRAEKMDESLV